MLGVGVCDVLPRWQESRHLQSMILDKMQELEKKKSVPLQAAYPLGKDKEKQDIASLYRMMASCDVQIKTLMLGKKTLAGGGELVHFVASAQYLSVLTLIQAIHVSSSFILLSADLKIPADDSRHLLFEGDILWLPAEKTQIKAITIPRVSAFCQTRYAYPEKINELSSVQGMHMLAYLLQGDKAQAVVRMADGRFLTIEKGQVIGKERAKVVDVSSQGVLARINNELIRYK